MMMHILAKSEVVIFPPSWHIHSISLSRKVLWEMPVLLPLRKSFCTPSPGLHDIQACITSLAPFLFWIPRQSLRRLKRVKLSPLPAKQAGLIFPFILSHFYAVAAISPAGLCQMEGLGGNSTEDGDQRPHVSTEGAEEVDFDSKGKQREMVTSEYLSHLIPLNASVIALLPLKNASGPIIIPMKSSAIPSNFSQPPRGRTRIHHIPPH